MIAYHILRGSTNNNIIKGLTDACIDMRVKEKISKEFILDSISNVEKKRSVAEEFIKNYED